MEVHDRLPSGLSAAGWRALRRSSPGRARAAAVRAAFGVAGLVAVLAPFGVLWATLGALLLLSVLPALRDAGLALVVPPALVLDTRPVWAGRRFTAWRLEVDGLGVDEVAEVVVRMRRALDAAAGPTVEVGDATTTRAAWGLGREAAIDALEVVDGSGSPTAPDAGVWLRIDRPPDGGAWVVTWLAIEGDSTEALRRAATVAA